MLTELLWLKAKIEVALAKRRTRRERASEAARVVAIEAERDVAYLQDHGGVDARPSNAVAQSTNPNRDDGSGGPKILIPPRIDGGTAWRLLSPAGKAWLPWRELREAARTKAKTVDLVDQHGEVIVMSFERGERGGVVLETGRLRLELQRSRAEIQITALACEVEGPEHWFGREIPRVIYWLTRRTFQGKGLAETVAFAAEGGLEQLRIEQACDLAGFPMHAGLDRGLVGRGRKWKFWDTDSVINGCGIGERSASPSSIAVYGKTRETERRRGPERVALKARLEKAGAGDQNVTRIEGRNSGAKGLRFVAEDGSQIDATNPGAAFDPQIRAALWVDSLTRYRLCEPRQRYWERLAAWERAGSVGKPPRLRDEPEHPAWTLARNAAIGGVAGKKMRRDLSRRTRKAADAHALDRATRASADLGVLRNADAETLLGILRGALGGKAYGDARRRAQARYGELIREAETESARSESSE